ncbi:hypothetical protein I600_3807 [Maribacter dokdonensis DSW-8]|nr:hypothetical protein I600_3807 [Maribacter dokdonensis DSW-8]
MVFLITKSSSSSTFFSELQDNKTIASRDNKLNLAMMFLEQSAILIEIKNTLFEWLSKVN